MAGSPKRQGMGRMGYEDLSVSHDLAHSPLYTEERSSNYPSMAMITTPWLYLFPLVTLAVPLILRLLTPRGISGVPALPNPKPIVGDLFTLIDAFKRLGGLGARTEELVKTYGPIFQLRIFSQR